MALRKADWATDFLGFKNKNRTYEAVRRGHLPPGVVVWLGRQLRFDEEALRRFCEKGGAPINKQQPAVSAAAQ